MRKGLPAPPRIQNRKARFEFELIERFEAGICLTGSEVKSLRAGQASLDEAYGFIEQGEAWLKDCNIAPYPMAGYAQHQPTRPRKLLLKRSEIKKLTAKVTQRGWTLVPLEMFFNEHGLVKIGLALARGKTHDDKRAALKERDSKREIDRAMRRR